MSPADRFYADEPVVDPIGVKQDEPASSKISSLTVKEPSISLDALKRKAKNCRACPLWKNATQTVFGEGTPSAKIVLVGEQPGNDEDLAGRPFVGPAGKLLNRALLEAGIDPKQAYVTNIVKHFKWEPKGKRRLHKKPNASEIAACRQWLDAELALLKPRLLLCLGATAAQALLGKDFKVSQRRGELLESELADHAMATVHPSSILRAPNDESRHTQMKQFVDDLKKAAKLIGCKIPRTASRQRNITDRA